MPRIAEFFGVEITMYFNDHPPPHFHAIYAEHEAVIRLDSLELLRGSLPRRALALVLEWSSMHRDELRDNWRRAREGMPLQPIQPLE